MAFRRRCEAQEAQEAARVKKMRMNEMNMARIVHGFYTGMHPVLPEDYE